MSGITVETTDTSVRVHSTGWYAAFADAVLDKAVQLRADNGSEMVVVRTPMQTLDNLPLTDTVLRALRLVVDLGIATRELSMETKEIFQHHEDGAPHIFVTIQT